MLVQVDGSNFRLPSAPPPTGVTPKPKPSLKITFGGRDAYEVAVVSATRLYARLPIGDPAKGTISSAGTAVTGVGTAFLSQLAVGSTITAAGQTRTVTAIASDTALTVNTAFSPVLAGVVFTHTVAVTVTNIDDNGVAIPGETFTLPAAFSFQRPRLTDQADYTRLLRVLVRALKREVIENTLLTVSTDYAAVGAAVVELAQFPALVLVGPDEEENRFFSLNYPTEEQLGGGLFSRKRVPYTIDLRFDVLGMSDSNVELLNLAALLKLFFQRNPYLYMDRDPSDLSKGQVRYEMDFTPEGDLKRTGAPNLSNVRSFNGTFVIRGFDVEAMASFPAESEVARGGVITDDGIFVDLQAIGGP